MFENWKQTNSFVLSYTYYQFPNNFKNLFEFTGELKNCELQNNNVK